MLAITDIQDTSAFNKKVNHWADLHLGGGKRSKLDQPIPTITPQGTIQWDSQASGWGPPNTLPMHEAAQDPDQVLGLIHQQPNFKCKVAYARAALTNHPNTSPQSVDWQYEYMDGQDDDREDVYQSTPK